MADWLMWCGLPDAMADRRGTYSTYDEFRKAMRIEGGIIKSCETRFAKIGMQPCQASQTGDVCLIEAPAKTRSGRIITIPTGAIAVNGNIRAVVTSDIGLVFTQAPIIRNWSNA